MSLFALALSANYTDPSPVSQKAALQSSCDSANCGHMALLARVAVGVSHKPAAGDGPHGLVTGGGVVGDMPLRPIDRNRKRQSGVMQEASLQKVPETQAAVCSVYVST